MIFLSSAHSGAGCADRSTKLASLVQETWLRRYREEIGVISVSLKLSIVITMLKVVSDQGAHLSSKFLINTMQCY